MTSADVRADDSKPGTGADPRTWFERYGDYLYRFALARVRRSDVAEDLVQETLLAAWKARAEFNGQASERTWLTAILKRKVIDWLRRRVREQTEPAAPDPFADELLDRRGEWKSVPGRWDCGTAVEPLDRAQFWTILHGCLDKLPARLHEVFALRYLDDAGCDDVCRETGLAPANLYVMLHRARLRMWQCLSKNWFGESPQEKGSAP